MAALSAPLLSSSFMSTAIKLTNRNYNSKSSHQFVVSLFHTLTRRGTFTTDARATILATIDPRSGLSSEDHLTPPQRLPKRSSKSTKHSSTYRFLDQVRLRVTGGNGGKGCLSYESMLGSAYKKRPDGGHGGSGGNVILVADETEQSLRMNKYHYKGEDGKNGSSKQMHGRNGRDQIIRVPCGVVAKRVIPMSTSVWDETGDYHHIPTVEFPVETNFDTNHDDDDDDDDKSYIDENVGEDIDNSFDLDNKVFEENEQYHSYLKEQQTIIDDSTTHSYMDNNQFVSSSEEMYSMEEYQKETIADLDQPGSFVIVAKGGRGGVGNCTLAKRQHIPELVARAHEKAQGEQGEVVHLELELKLIADVGLVGYPNAGKSSLLAAVSKAMPKIAPYPFTTIHPWVGAVEYRDGFRVVLADVPGLIGGASQGRGRGFDFLRHLERTKALVYLLDAAGVDGRDPLIDLRVLVEEIHSYGNGDMLQRPALVVANKMDLIHDPQVQDEILNAISVVGKECGIQFDGEVHGISAGVSGEGLPGLSVAMRSLVEKS
eukprot:CAMPEP_0176486482 /NCGR_PEP_ID=MMETSP0200_2-20121128/5590_1 /TAXON_ID=947934 /ORGANISM="Chaetoceros sp., Strain GSL56" /LENGTH=543 /DNA_ID=CAMNT_0017883183 /DNA_START=410 /DNA_END=2041 /DNA_ORIENTATION=+